VHVRTSFGDVPQRGGAKFALVLLPAGHDRQPLIQGRDTQPVKLTVAEQWSLMAADAKLGSLTNVQQRLTLDLGERDAMQNLLLVIIIGLFVFWLGRFALGLIRGRVKGSHPVEKKLAWIARTEHPRHFWAFTLLQIVLFVILASVILGLWNTPAF